MYLYPSIPGWKEAPLGRPCIGFYKYDGSNLRFEWSRKTGWNKFGTRHRLFDEADEPYNQAIPLFFERFAEEVAGRIGKEFRGVERITAFTEFFGDSSFAGNHVVDEQKQLVLFDVHVYKVGILPPRDFLKIFKNTQHVAEVVYEGNFNRQLIEDVRNGKYDVYEGMVCKGVETKRNWAAKIKTLEYLERLKGEFGDRWIEFADGQ